MPGTWQPLANQPSFSASTMLLLTDGTVMCQESGGAAWWRLSPDEWGDYTNGTWSPLSPMIDDRLYYASAVLADGRVFVAGGEYHGGGQVDWNRVEIYDPVADVWSQASTPGWTAIGDAPCCVLPDGKVLLGSIHDTRTALYDPVTGTWSPGGDKTDPSEEEGFTLLPDGTVLAVQDSKPPEAEKYLSWTGSWVSAGATPVSLVESNFSIEIGPSLLRPDGTVFQVGGNGHTAVYHPRPGHPDDTGSWTAGPDLPQNPPGQLLKANDAPGCVLPGGHVLLVAGIAPDTGGFASPGYFFEFDGQSLIPAPAPGNAGGNVYEGRMLLLPTGQVLFAAGTDAVEVYTPVGDPDDEWRPRITEHPRHLHPGHTYTLHGHRFNGMTQAVAYGDDATMATNYPIARLIGADGRVYYCRTHDHSTMGVATGGEPVHTRFTVPATVPAGRYDLRVVANGIASPEVDVRVT